MRTMTTNPVPYRLQLFTLRLWQEVVNGELWEWRGEVKNTSTGEFRYFRDFHVLGNLLALLLADPASYDGSEQQVANEPSNLQHERTMTTTQSLEAGVQATNRIFEAAFARRDSAGAAAVYTTDAQAFPPNGATVSGHGALQSFWQGVMDMGVKNITLETVELEPCGERAFEVGKATLHGEGRAIMDTVKFIVVWEQENGQWKWHRDIWNSSNPT